MSTIFQIPAAKKRNANAAVELNHETHESSPRQNGSKCVPEPATSIAVVNPHAPNCFQINKTVSLIALPEKLATLRRKMAQVSISDIKTSLRELYLADARPWLVGFSGGKDSTLVASLIFDTVLAVPAAQRTKEIAIVCTDTRVEIPAIVEMIETMLAKMRKCSVEQNLNIEAHLLRPPAEQSFWVNIIGRGYPPPNRVFRWCTQRMKIDPVSRFVEQRMGRWSEAVLHLVARRVESATREIEILMDFVGKILGLVKN